MSLSTNSPTCGCGLMDRSSGPIWNPCFQITSDPRGGWTNTRDHWMQGFLVGEHLVTEA